MKLLLAPDSFKGSLASHQIIDILSNAAKKVFEDCEITAVPMADGGEGTLDAILETVKGKKEYIQVKNPLLEDIKAAYGMFGDKTAFIEMAAASGLTLIPYKNGNAMNTSSYGTGQLIADAMKKGFGTIYVAIGGSATNDGGIGMMTALGVKFIDEKGKILEPIGRNLIKIKKIDITNINPLIKKTKFIGICDVNNVLLGENGATFIYGPQKGANGKYKIELEKGMENYAGLLNETFGRNVNSIKGAGAAGGIGAAMLTFLNAKLKSGIETIFEIIDFDNLLKDTDLVVTGEGRIDAQSACGKILAGIGKHAKKYNIPVIAIAGSLGTGHEKLYKMGITSMISTVSEIMTLEHAIKNSTELLDNAAERMFKIIKAGLDIKSRK